MPPPMILGMLRKSGGRVRPRKAVGGPIGAAPSMDDLLSALRNADKAGDADSARRISRLIQDQQNVGRSIAAQPTPAVDPVMDAATGVGSGATLGTAHLAGAPGDFSSWGLDRIKDLAGLLGIGGTPDELARLGEALQKTRTFQTTDEILAQNKKVQDYAHFDPKTNLGKDLKAGTELIPSAVVLGGANTVKGIASSALKLGVAPGVLGEEAARAVPEDFKPWARIAGNVIGGSAASIGANAARWTTLDPLKSLAAVRQGSANLKTQADSLFDIVDKSGLMVGGNIMQTGVQGIRTSLENADASFSVAASAAPGTKPAFGELRAALDTIEAMSTRPMSFSALQTARAKLRDAFSSDNPSERRLAAIATKEFDKFVTSLNQSDMVAMSRLNAQGQVVPGLVGSPKATIAAFNNARSTWARQASMADKAKMINDILENAETRVASGSPNSKVNVQDKIRQGFGNLDIKLRGADGKYSELGNLFTPAERSVITSIARGEPVENGFRKLGSVSPDWRSLLELAAGAGTLDFLLRGSPKGAGLTAVGVGSAAVAGGAAARAAANLRQADTVKNLSDTVLNNGTRVIKTVPGTMGPSVTINYGADAFRTPSIEPDLEDRYGGGNY